MNTSVDEKASTLGLVEFVSSKGHKFFGRPNTEDLVTFEYVVDRNEYNLPLRFKSDDIIIDIGAHIGSFSYAVLLRGANRVYAFEAHPDNYAIACENLAAFVQTVKCRNLAVWRSDQPPTTLFNEDITSYTKTGGISVLWNNAGLPVKTIGLDKVLFEASDGFRNPIRLLKLDCEGSEYPIMFTSKHLEIVEEICGEYHELEPAQIPERAKITGCVVQFNKNGLKEFLESRGWSIDLEPRSEVNGLFHARRRDCYITDRLLLEPEINVEELKERIREAVTRRKACGKTSFITASSDLYKLLASKHHSAIDDFRLSELASIELAASSHEPSYDEPNLVLQPEFKPRSSDSYDVNELLKYHDSTFIWNAFRALLKREPDEHGFRNHLGRLRGGRFNKIDILSSIRFSPEGRRRQVEIEGLFWRAMIRRFYRLPVVGYFAELIVALVRLPVLMRNKRQFESYTVAQQERIADYLNKIKRELTAYTKEIREELYHHSANANQANVRLADSFNQRVAQLAERQNQMLEDQSNIAKLQHQQLSALFEMLKELEKGTSGSVLTRGANEPIESSGSPTGNTNGQLELDAFYASLVATLRGKEEDVKTDLQGYLELLRESGISTGIVDLGCGRGEWLDVLKAEGLQAQGVEANRTLGTSARTRGLNIVEADVFQFVRGLPADSLQAITGFHLIEHLPFHRLLELLDEIQRVLKPGGLVIVETPNPENLVVGACNFYSDPTHLRPLFPATLRFIFEYKGFERVNIQYLHPVGNSPFTNEDPSSQALHTWLFGPRDYSVIAWKELKAVE